MRSYLRFASVVGAFALSTVAIAPAMAASPVSQAGANAVNLSVANNPQGSGDATAKNDGTTETKTGQDTPPLAVLGGQQLISAGALAQEATAKADGSSAACAGLAGAGGSVVNIGGSSCLSSGDGALDLSLGSLDLSGVELFDPASALGAINTVPIQTVLGPVTTALQSALAASNTDLGDLGLSANLDAISSHCTANPEAAQGDSDFTDVNVTLTVPGQPPVVLLDLKPNYPVDTNLAVNLDTAVNVLLQAVEDNLRESLTGAFAPLADAVVAPVREALVTQVLSQVSAQLGPLTDIANLTLNHQVRDGNSIKVRALDLSVLDAAQAQLGAPLVSLQIGNSACGPNTRRAAAVAAPETAAPAALPTAVSAGYATMPGEHAAAGDDSTNAIVLGAFALLMATAAGFITFRRLRG